MDPVTASKIQVLGSVAEPAVRAALLAALLVESALCPV